MSTNSAHFTESVAASNPVADSGGDDDTLVQNSEQAKQSQELSRQFSNAPNEIPGYTIVRSLGEGAYGSVWLAEQHNTGKLVAVKFYTHRRGLDWSLLSREVEKLAVLYTSRNIVRLQDVGWESDPPYYVMEYLENGSLAAALADGPLPPEEAVQIAKAILQALAHAHGSGILHCDLKPANVLLDADFAPRLCDFGQSRLSNEQTPALGTLFYMAPEQASEHAIPDVRWDVYALGALLYHMLTGRPPHRTPEAEQKIREGKTLNERLAAYREVLQSGDFKPDEHRKVPGVDRRLADIVDRCLHIDLQRRYPNAQVVLDALDARDRYRSQRPLIALGFVGPLLLLAAMAFSVWNVMQTAVTHARQSVTERALEGDTVAAQFLAKSLYRDLIDRMWEMEEVASLPELRDAVLQSTGKSGDERLSHFHFLELVKTQISNKRQSDGLSTDASWFVTDDTGVQLWRHPGSGTIGQRFAFRHYFHGDREAGEYDKNNMPDFIPAGDTAFISLPFLSNATGKYMVAIRAPIFADSPGPGEGRDVVGVLARTIHLEHLLDEHGQLLHRGLSADGSSIHDGNARNVDRLIALVDRNRGNWTLLDHPWWDSMPESKLRDLPKETFDRLCLDESLSATLEQSVEAPGWYPVVSIANYRDPASNFDQANYGGEWLAALSRVGTLDWYAIVQERKRSAGAPVDEMQSGLVLLGTIALAISCGLIAVLWYFVQRELRERGSRSWARRRSGLHRNGAMDTSGSTA